jgi:hypothetical protein
MRAGRDVGPNQLARWPRQQLTEVFRAEGTPRSTPGRAHSRAPRGGQPRSITGSQRIPLSQEVGKSEARSAPDLQAGHAGSTPANAIWWPR